MKNSEYIAVKNYTGIRRHKRTKKYQALVKFDGALKKKSFLRLRDAIEWRKDYSPKTSGRSNQRTTRLKDVWEEMQRSHFPTLAMSTQQIWIRRYHLLKDLEELRMDKITPGVISSWVERHVSYYKSEKYIDLCRGGAKRCNLNNELNLFTSIFNWYKSHEDFEEEAKHLQNPIRTKHKDAGFIRPKPIKNRAIKLEDALDFFNYLKPLYRDLAMVQFYTASRIGEVAGLQWSRINLERREMVIMETCQWDMTTKTYTGLNPHPKNKEPRPVFITDELLEILRKRKLNSLDGCNFVFHVEGKPLNYGTIQINYKSAQRKGNLPYSGTHILRHGMATLARKVGGGLDAVIAMTGHKDLKLADHYSKLTNDIHKETSLKVMAHIKKIKESSSDCSLSTSNVLNFHNYSNIN